jgi:hypothetical protein
MSDGKLHQRRHHLDRRSAPPTYQWRTPPSLRRMVSTLTPLSFSLSLPLVLVLGHTMCFTLNREELTC